MDNFIDVDIRLDDFIQNILEKAFAQNLVLFGGGVRSILREERPSDLDFAYKNKSHKEQFLKHLSQEGFKYSKIESKYNLMCQSYTLSYSINSIDIDLVYYNTLGKDLDFDINSLNMFNFEIKMPKNLNLKMENILANIKSKKFNILQDRNVDPNKLNRSVNIKAHSSYLIRFIKMQARTTKLLSNGWIPYGSLEEHFYPLLIKENNNNVQNVRPCSLCNTKLDQRYCIQLNCCGRNLCNLCPIEYVRANFENLEIFCPLCLGDPFGLNTANPIFI